VLAQWAAAAGDRAVLWLDVDRAHADSVSFIDDLLHLLARIEPAAVPPLTAMTRAESRSLTTRLVPRIERWLRSVATPFLLIIDDADRLADPASFEALEAVARALPPRGSLALGCREDPAMRLASLRAGRRLLEVGPDLLAMDAAEAGLLFNAMGVRLAPDEIERVLERTEGGRRDW
jgi:LuxR family transcriptional regulator, maltose regulon positive regulatory protein